jgi:16S rRNA C967 or C1407 C5-methylase (RsmB/RsmF family)
MGKGAATPSRTLRGAEGFEQTYASWFGDRWPALRAALLSPHGAVARQNRFADTRGLQARSGLAPHPGLAGCLRGESLPAPEQDGAGLTTHYLLDAASVRVARALPLTGAGRVADLCAAPGGKSLILAESLEPGATLVCNEWSEPRRFRLRATLRDYLPAEVLARVQVTGMDASRWCLREPASYDAILLDAPCSSESHVLRDAAALSEWSSARSRQLAMRQFALLSSAFEMLRVGGRVLYATCALAEVENDGVVGRLLERRGDAVRQEPLDLGAGRPTRHGVSITPDLDGEGPMFASLLQKCR